MPTYQIQETMDYHRYQYLRDLPWVELLFLRPFPFWAVEAVALQDGRPSASPW